MSQLTKVEVIRKIDFQNVVVKHNDVEQKVWMGFDVTLDKDFGIEGQFINVIHDGEKEGKLNCALFHSYAE